LTGQSQDPQPQFAAKTRHCAAPLRALLARNKKQAPSIAMRLHATETMSPLAVKTTPPSARLLIVQQNQNLQTAMAQWGQPLRFAAEKQRAGIM
jgi:hypothetical protein